MVQHAVAVDDVELAARERKREERRDHGVHERLTVERGPAVEEREVEVGAEDLHARDALQQACLGPVPAADVEQLPAGGRRAVVPTELDPDEVLAVPVRVRERELVVLKGEPLRAEARLGQTLARPSLADGRPVATDRPSMLRGERRVEVRREVE